MKKLLIAITLFLVGCGEQSSNIKPTIDRVGQEMTVKVFFYPDSESLEEAYRKVNNLSEIVPVPEQWGFAQWNEWRSPEGIYIEPETPRYWCNIYVIQSKRQGDQNPVTLLTLGHELLHCLYGSYHN